MEALLAKRMNEIYSEKMKMLGNGMTYRKKRAGVSAGVRAGVSAGVSAGVRAGKCNCDCMYGNGYGTRKGALKGWKTRYGEEALKGEQGIEKIKKKLKKIKKNNGGVVVGGMRAGVRAGVRAGAKRKPNDWVKFVKAYRAKLEKKGVNLPYSEILKLASKEYK